VIETPGPLLVLQSGAEGNQTNNHVHVSYLCQTNIHVVVVSEMEK